MSETKETQRVSDTLNRLSESATLAMARKSRELKAQGLPVISLSLGEPDFDTPAFIKEAAKKAIDDNYTHYPPVSGYVELRDSISKKFLRDNQLHYSADQIVVSTGAKQSIANAVLALISSGDKVLLPAPYWVSYSEIVKLAGGTPVTIKTDIGSDFKITPAQLAAHMGEGTRMLIFSSPCNPSGSVYTSEELDALAEEIAKHPQLIVISDEIYELIVFEGKNDSLARRSNVYEQIITVNGVSKAFAMTGWRLGYLGAPEWIAKACAKMQGQTTSAPCGISQMAAKAAVEANPSVINYMLDAFKSRRKLVLEALNTIAGLKVNEPEGAFYVFPDAGHFIGKYDGSKKIENSDELCMYLLEKHNIALVGGVSFGSPECIRISYAASEPELIEATKRIKSGLESLTDKPLA